ncbi:MAG: nucleotidyltransferase domain-containing protein [Thermoproteus sp.]
MSRDFIVAEWERRRRVLSDLWRYLSALKEAVLELDPDAEVYLFGSAARGDMRPDSDVDVLVVSDRYGGDLRRIAELLVRVEERLGVTGIFEIHVATREQYEGWYKRHIDVKVRL